MASAWASSGDPFASPGTPSAETPGGFPLSADETAVYDHLYKLADPTGKLTVQPQEAVAFLSKSRLPQNVLSEIWQQADSDRKGYLTQADFWKSLKMIALAQSGKSPNLSSLGTSTPIPVFEGVAVPHRTAPVTSHLTGGNQFAPAAAMSPQRTGPLSTHNTGGSGLGSGRVASHNTGGTQVSAHTTGGPGRYDITSEERDRFSAAFASCGPVDGTVSGDAARDLFMRSTLPVDQLGRIWSLVDTNAAGKLTLPQFTVAMYLITKLRQGVLSTIPPVVPADLWAAVNRSARSSSESISDPVPSAESPLPGLAPSPSARPLNRMSTMLPGTASPRMDRRRTMIGSPGFSVNTDWAVTAEEKSQFDQYFDAIDVQKKSFVTGQESYDLFLKAKLPQSELAKIWDLADKEKRGNLRKEEFAVAMHLIRARMAGDALPQTLPADLVPPSMRGAQQTSLGSALSTQPTRSSTADLDLMGDFTSSPSPQPTETAALSKPAFEAPRSLSFSNIPSAHEVADFQNRERDLASRKHDLQQVEQQIELLQPTVEELRQKRAEIDAEYKSATEKRNEMAMQLSQLRGVYETESQITTELEQELRREQQMVQIGAQELQQAQQTVAMLTQEKENLEQTLQQTLKYNEDAKRIIAETTDAAAPLRIELEKLRAELHKQVQHRQVNDQLLEAAQRDYQQVHGDVQIETANLEREKSRNLHVTQQIAVQSSINERERLRLQGLIAEKEAEAVKSQAAPALPAAVKLAEPKGDIYAAFSAAGATALPASEGPPAIQTRQPSVANGLVSPSPVTPVAGTPTKKPPPRPPAAKKPERGQPLTPLNGTEVPGAGHMTPESTKSMQTPQQKDLSTPKLSGSPAPVTATASGLTDVSPGKSKPSSPAKTSEKDDFEALFQSNKPTTKRSIDSLAAAANASRPSPASGFRAASPLASTTSPLTAPAQATPTTSSPGGKTSKGGFSLGFEPRKDSGEGGGKRSGSSSASVRSLPLLDKQDAAKTETPLSAPVTNSAHQLNVANDEDTFSFSTAPGSLSALADTTVSTANLAADSAIAGNAGPASHLDREFGVGHADGAAGFSNPDFDADFASVFPQATPAPTGSVSSSDGQRPPPIEPVPDSRPLVKRTDTALPEVDLEAEFKDGFADAQVAAQGSPSKLPVEFDDAAFVAGRFDDDAFSFDSSFRDFASPAGAGAASVVAPPVIPEFEADFAAAFSGGSDPFAASAFSFGEPLAKTPDFASSAATQMSAADMDALFGGGGGSVGSATVGANNENDSAFDDAFAADAFTTAFGAAPSPKKSAGNENERPPPPALPQRKETADDAEEVKQIVALGFSKEQAVNALDLNGFDVAKATNYLLDAK
ncbi:hypothetical protein HDU87_005380 [Geranomyces variabilis]|uniref:Uncharacterized protein n=1 Tax=Geranomyces variabilis TaxID=109894 RepID=A0AAD5XPV4_9FUNG|nr:hypothetical protein HDU87_005380 [Geranomyces variabilis]